MQSSSERPLRFGIMCDKASLQEWQVRCLSDLLAQGNASLALIILRDANSPNVRDLRMNDLLFRIYTNVFVRPRARRSIGIKALCAKVPTVNCRVIRKGRFSEYFSPADVQKIKGFELDFILRLGFGILRGEILNATRYGIWSFHHDDEKKYRGRPACLWEVYKGDHVTGAVLQRLTERLDAGIVLKKGYFKTVRHSYTKNLDHVLSESARWPAQVCVDVRNGEADYLASEPSATRARIFHRPDNLQTCTFILKILKRRLEVAYRLLFRHTVWNVGIVHAPIHAFLSPRFKPAIQWFPRSREGQIWADPFGRANGGKVQVLFEKLDYDHPRGIICAVEIGAGGLPTQPKVVIEEPVHMSYPYLFEYQGETYCIPETNQARETSVYKANEFPYQWTKVANILKNVRAIDTTMFQHDGKWWMTFTDRDRGGDANLYLWYALDLWGPWTPHALSPVKTDIRSARPGGTPFEYEGSLYRPAQDCSRTGGGRIILNRVEHLTPTRFLEEPVAIIEPHAGSVYREGLHTLSQAGRFTLIDGKRFMFVPSSLLANAARGIRKLIRRRPELAQQDS